MMPSGMLEFGMLEWFILFFLLLFVILPPFLGYKLAKAKNRPPVLWAFVCLIFPPCVLLILCLSPEAASRPQKICQYCAELILQDAKLCKHCGRDV